MICTLDRNDNVILSLTQLIFLNSFMGAYGLIQISMFMLVLPKLCRLLFPGYQADSLALLIGAAGSTQLVCPVAGLLSDRTTSSLGRRRPFIIFGTVGALLSLLILWFITSNDALVDTHDYFSAPPDEIMETNDLLPGTRALFILVFVLFNVFLNICFAAYSGLIPDFVQAEQVGESSGIMALMNTLGAITGVMLVGFWNVEPFSLYAVWLIICGAVTLTWLQEKPLLRDPQKINCSTIFGVYFESLDDHNFFWVWISRLFYYMGISIQVFMQYYLRDIVKIPEEDIEVKTSVIIVVMLGCSSLISIPCGMISDRIGRRPLIYMSCILMAFTYLAWSLSTTMWYLTLVSVFFGFANGCFISVEFAIGCDAIPDKEEKGAQALGVWGIAGFLGSTMGPMLNGPLLFIVGRKEAGDGYSRAGYLALLFAGAVLVISSSLVLTRLRLKEK